MYEQARQYLARVLPWPQDGEPPAFIDIVWTFMPDDGLRPGQDKLPWTGRAVRTLDEAINVVSYQMTRASTRDIYACMSTQRQAEEKTGKNNYRYFKAIRNQSNAVALKSLFIDIDFKGGEKGYDTKDEAVENLARFLRETQLPKPSLLVLSGGGIHVYWTLVRALCLQEWQPLAYALAEATKRHNLKCDSQCTVDAARVLRVPNTFNRKLEEPRPVTLAGDTQLDYAIEAFEQALAPYKVALGRGQVDDGIKLPADFGPISDKFKALKAENDLAAGVEDEHPPVKIKDVAMECAFVRDALLTGGATYTNPEWNLTTLLATFTENGRANAHLMGSKHPGYTKESTDAEYDRKEREKVQKGLGWPSCVAISAAGCKACQSCKHFAAGKTPIHATFKPAPVPVGPAAPAAVGTVAAVTSQVTLTDLPSGYTRDPKDGRIMKIETSDGADGNPVQELKAICEYSMEDPYLEMPANVLNFKSRVERGKHRTISIPLDIIATMEMRKHLQSQSFMLPVGVKATENVSRFLMSWTKMLQETRDSVHTAPMGWSHNGPIREGFVYNRECHTPNGPRQAAAIDPVIDKQYAPVGDITVWMEAARLITDQKRPGLDLILASSFAAPLVQFSGEPGVLLSCYSKETGAGKTTALKVALSVWADPVGAKQGLTDTQNSVMGKLGKIQSLPMYWDEIKSEEQTKKFVEITFQTSEGKEKSRMSRDIKQREPGRWRTLLVSCSNESLLDYISKQLQTTTAGLHRVFQVIVPHFDPNGPGRIVASDAGRMTSKLEYNFGQAGLIYSKFLGANHEQIDKDMGDLMRDLQVEVSSTSEERYWMVAISSCILGARYANQLGLTQINEGALKQYLLSSLKDMRAFIASQMVDIAQEVNLYSVVAQFFNAMRARHTIFTDRMHFGQGKPPANYVNIKWNMSEQNKLEGVFVHAAEKDKVIRVSRTQFVGWLRQKNYSPDIIIREMQHQWGVTTVQGRLASGTQFRSIGAEVLYHIDLARCPQLDPFTE